MRSCPVFRPFPNTMQHTPSNTHHAPGLNLPQEQAQGADKTMPRHAKLWVSTESTSTKRWAAVTKLVAASPMADWIQLDPTWPHRSALPQFSCSFPIGQPPVNSKDEGTWPRSMKMKVADMKGRLLPQFFWPKILQADEVTQSTTGVMSDGRPSTAQHPLHE